MRSTLRRLLAGVAVSVLGASPSTLRAQQATTVSGVVTNEAGAPIEGASVLIPSAGIGSNTKADGHFSFLVPAGRASGTVTLLARRLGFQPKTVSISLAAGNVVQNFQLSAVANQLEGVVISALGIAREKSQLGTAQQQITSDALNTTRDPNVLNQLEGKVSGVNITGAGIQGGSTNITVRGYTSINGSNEPLFIVDGVPVSNKDHGGNPTGGGAGNYTNGMDLGSAIQDLNPDDIESLNVLKGPNAAAIYGSRAANGAIVITTKKGRTGGVGMAVSSSVTFDRPSILPTYQNMYGQGSSGQFKFVDGAGGGINDGADQSYGPKLDGRLIDQFTGKQQPWIAHPDNVQSFFNTGRTYTSNVALTGGTDKANARVSLGGENVEGIVPNNALRRISSLISGQLKLSDRFSTNASLNYVRNTGLNRPGVGYSTSILEQFVWFGRQVDVEALRHYLDANGNQFNWNYNYHNNPFWLQYANPERDTRDRLVATGSATYQVTDWLNATLRSGTDTYRYNIDQDFAAGNQNYADPSYNGAFAFTNIVENENNTDLLLNASRELTSRISANVTAGGNRRLANYNTSQIATTGITVPGVYNPSNAAVTPTITQYTQNRAINSVYGSAAFTWDGWWTVEGTARNDWSSTLPQSGNSYFYPSVNTSVVLTDALPSLKSSVLDYAKLRGSIARVGADASPYQLRTTFQGGSNKFGSLPVYTLNDTLANAGLRPEETTSSEVGVELGFLGGRVTADASVYEKYTNDQIINLAVSNTSGYSYKAVNAGKIDNKGFEALLDVAAYRGRDLKWNSTLNVSTNRGRVVSLAPGLQTIVLGTTWNMTEEARAGEPYGTIRGYTIKKDAAGNWLLKDGLPQAGPFSVLGNVQPKWVGGWNNNVHYKQFTVNALLDVHVGGKFFSVTNMFGENTGVLSNTLQGREADWDKPGIVVHGIDEVTGKANTDTVTSEQYFQSFFRLHERYVYDDSYVKFRELRVSMDLSPAVARRFYASSASVSLSGRNLFTWTRVPNVDPEFSYTSGNFNGAEFATLPNPRSIGFDVRITP